MNYVIQNENLDIDICFWNIKKVTETQYFNSQFFNRPDVDNIVDAILQSSQKLKLHKFSQLPMDGPNVNWSVLDKFILN